MSLGRQTAQQSSFWVARHEMPASPGNPFYEKLNELLRKEGFDAFVEDLCAPFYAKHVGRRSIPPGRYFRMLLLGAGPVFPHAAFGLLRGHRLRARHLLALPGLLVRARVRGALRHGLRPGSLLHDPHSPKAPPGDAPCGVRASAEAVGQAQVVFREVFGSGFLHHGGQRLAQGDRASGHGRELSGDAFASGEGEWDRDADQGAVDRL